MKTTEHVHRPTIFLDGFDETDVNFPGSDIGGTEEFIGDHETVDHKLFVRLQHVRQSVVRSVGIGIHHSNVRYIYI